MLKCWGLKRKNAPGLENLERLIASYFETHPFDGEDVSLLRSLADTGGRVKRLVVAGRRRSWRRRTMMSDMSETGRFERGWHRRAAVHQARGEWFREEGGGHVAP